MRASISLWSGDVRSIDDLSARVGVAADCFHIDLIDQVILMGATPGVRGADLHEETPGRVHALVDARRLNNEAATEPSILVEGAVREHTLEALAAAGCDGVVVGALVLASADPKSVIRRIADLSPHLSRADWTMLASDDPRDALSISPFASLRLMDHQHFVYQYLALVDQIDIAGLDSAVLTITADPHPTPA